MEDLFLNLEVIHVISDPQVLKIWELITKKRHVSFNDLKIATELSNDGLTKQIEKLQKLALIKGEVTDPQDGRYSFFHLTKLGEQFLGLLQDTLSKTIEIQPEPISDKFVVDSVSFEKIWNYKKAAGTKKIFDHSTIILTNHDYASLKHVVDENDDTLLENFIMNEDKVINLTAYKDPESSTKIEYYLRRVKKLTANEARLVVTAIDSQASVITDNVKIAGAARSLGIVSANSEAVMNLKSGHYLWHSFYELSLKNPESKLNLPFNNIPLISKKN